MKQENETRETCIVYMYFPDGNTKNLPAICNSLPDNYKKLSEELIAKNINKCTWIKSIKRIQMYTHIKIVVTYDHGGKSVYNLYGSNV